LVNLQISGLSGVAEQSGEIHGTMTREKNHFDQVAVRSAARNIILRPLYVALRTSDCLVGPCGVHLQQYVCTDLIGRGLGQDS
jgi:hypothetical protein